MSILPQEVVARTLAPYRLGEIPTPDKHLESLLYQILASLLLKYHPQQLLNALNAMPLVYNRDRGDTDESTLPFGPLTLRMLVPNNANETKELSLAGPMDAAEIYGGGVPMLRQLIYNDILARGKTEAVAKEWGAVAAEFEQVCGLKESYNRADVTAFLAHLRKRGLSQSTINKDLKTIKLLAQIQDWQFPKLSLRRVSPDEIQRTILSKDVVGSIITLGRQGLLSNAELCYLVLSTVYGLRRAEMGRLQPQNLGAETLTVPTAKGGKITTHLVPSEIRPYLRHFRHYEPDSLTHMFHRILTKTGLSTTTGFGWHSIRRSLTTELVLSEASALNVMRFMRWSEASVKGEFGMLAIYAKGDQERIDKAIFKMHPFLPYWGTGEPRQVERARPPSKLQPLLDLIESGELGEEEIEQLLTVVKRLKEREF